MKSINKTRFAILGMLLDGPSSGYEIKSFMNRSTSYFWKESDSTIYPMLKLLAKEKKALSKIVFIGKKKKEVFSITSLGRKEFDEWMSHPTGVEVHRNEFLLKLFFVTDTSKALYLFKERLEMVSATHEEFKKIEERLETLSDSPRKTIRLKALRYGLSQLELEINWLKTEIREGSYVKKTNR